ncbi:hypothetical protein RND81_05G095900 [Saponaria officinalis]
MGGCSEPQQNGFCPNGLVGEDAASITRPLDPRRWAKAEERTGELISRIQPNSLSVIHRNAVASYVQRLVSNSVPCQVFTFGSVPLKTYLPDGDIDLTAFSEDQNVNDNWAKEVQYMLQMEEKNEYAEFPVKEVQLIHAEVKIIKCLVDNIVVDISFNQLGGLCTLCFLEEVDNLIGQSHLFKRSIILVKAWCYYESRILGAHHGLISTYALETLVLYIFHVFNNSFAGPLEVLYRFLEFFSKFDWANFCVSLWGPVPISSLPSMEAAPPRKDGGELLLSKIFLESCGTAYSNFPAGPELRENCFTSKHFNVIDPLRFDNNLGRSVSKGNFYRIRSAFKLGAQELAKIIECPIDDIVPKVNQFFVNTWERHGKGCRPDAPILDLGCHELDESHHSLGDSVHLNTFPLLTTARTTDSHKDLIAPKQKDIDESRCHMVSERSKLWKKQHDDIKRTCRMNILQTNGHTTHHFARTSSSPELEGASTEVASTYTRNVATVEVDDGTTRRPENSRRMIDSGTRKNHAAHFDDAPSIRESSSHRSPVSGSDSSSGSCVDKSVSSLTMPVVSSTHESQHRYVEEQAFASSLSSTGIQHHGEHAQMAVNLASNSFVPYPPSFMGYSHPTNLSAVEPDSEIMMNYSTVPFAVPFHQQFRPFRVVAEHDKTIRGLNERVVSVEVDHGDEHSGIWVDRNDHSNRVFDPESEIFSAASSRLSPASPSTSFRTKASSESSWDGKPGKFTNLSRCPVGQKTRSSRNSGATVSRRLEEDEPVDQTFEDVNDDQKDCFLPAAESVGQSVTTSVAVNQIPGVGQPQMISQNSMLPFGTMVAHPGSQHGVAHNPAVLPVAFYPAGPHVPFVTMVPIYNIPAETGSSGRGRDIPPYTMNRSDCSLNPTQAPEQLSHTDHYVVKKTIASGEHDIFNSDFTNHWKNLQYGRLCQGIQLSPFAYPSPVPGVVSPARPNTFAHAVPVSAPEPGPVKPFGVSRRYGGEVSKQRNGTGTYFPNPNMIKERECSIPRQYRRGWGHDRNENHGDRGANWNYNSKPRYNGRAQPRDYYEKQNMKINRAPDALCTEG